MSRFECEKHVLPEFPNLDESRFLERSDGAVVVRDRVHDDLSPTCRTQVR